MNTEKEKKEMLEFLKTQVLLLEKEQFLAGPAIENTGISISIIREGEIFLNASFGEICRESHSPMREETLFPIASITKSFTAAAVLQAYLDANVDFQTPISKLGSTYELNSALVTEQMNAFDLLSHRVGLPRHDYLWCIAKMPALEILSKVKNAEMNPVDGSGFRTSFQYNNISYAAAGKILEKLSHSSWEDWVINRILKPAKMNEIWMNYYSTPKDASFAKPYFRDLECNVFEEWTTAPAASMWSTARGLAEWVKLQMNRGNHEGRPLIQSELFEIMWAPHNSTYQSPEGATSFEVNQYGLGWFSDTIAGKRYIHHGGAVTGLSSYAAFCPDEKIGVVVLVNQTLSRLARTLGVSIISEILKISTPDLNKFAVPSLYSNETLMPVYGKPEHWQLNDSIKVTKKLEGTYTHPAYGEICFVQSASGGSFIQYFENEWPVIEETENGFILGTTWIGMPCKMNVIVKDEGLEMPFNLHLGTNRVIFKRAK